MGKKYKDWKAPFVVFGAQWQESFQEQKYCFGCITFEAQPSRLRTVWENPNWTDTNAREGPRPDQSQQIIYIYSVFQNTGLEASFHDFVEDLTVKKCCCGLGGICNGRDKRAAVESLNQEWIPQANQKLLKSNLEMDAGAAMSWRKTT